ncbi:hypothetical protein DITRI_Ditri01bG0148500 [Diplodiscus trichospermus]
MDSELTTSSSSPKYVYLFQREYASVDPALIHHIGIDEATTFVRLVILNRKNKMTSVALINSPKFVDIGFVQMLKPIVNYNSNVDLDVHLIGGFMNVLSNV